MPDIETVKEHCKHPDCMFRGLFDGDPCCKYTLVTGRPRVCSISECDKYAVGKLKVVQHLGSFEYEVDE